MIDIYIEPDGTAQAVYDDTLVELFDERDLVTRRASRVEPAAGGWMADLQLSGGPVLLGFMTRSQAIAAELRWLGRRLDAGRIY